MISEVYQPEVKEIFDTLTNVKDARKLYPVTDTCVYLDAAHYAAYSLETARRLKDYIDNFTHTNDNLTKFNLKMGTRLCEKCARLINADAQDIIITGNTTHGLNIFANGIDLTEGDTVAYADCEFPAVVYPWLNQEKLRGIKTVMIKSSPGGMVDEGEIERVIRDNNVKVLTISHVEFLGYRNNLHSIKSICDRYGCYLVVDAIQGTGVVPFDVNDPAIDYYATGSQKWMMAPAGIGFAYIKREMREHVKPTYASTLGVDYDFDNFLDYRLKFNENGTAYMNSTPNTLGMIGMESSIDLFLKLGVENIFRHIIHLQDVLINELEGSDFYVVSSMEEDHRSNILLLSHKDPSHNQAVRIAMEEKNIFIAVREGFIRVSAHLYNNEEDVLTLAREMKNFSVSSQNLY
ncbi:MAG: aminotransferase class V-fold PLP-dependent enzyme [Ignavibacteriae bacterium]|nr:aminotransferase class V-fold PLP-dependent enzyme [Ignavibacteriota bacterium]